jgi:hypothetical protein
MKKWGDLHLTLQLNIWIAMTICNSFTTHCNLVYFYGHECYSTSCTNYNRYNSSYMKPYTYAICITHLQLCRNNYCVTLIQLICNYRGNVMLTSFFIDPSKFDTWHYEDFWVIFWKYWFPPSLWLFIYNGFRFWYMPQQKLPRGILIEF